MPSWNLPPPPAPPGGDPTEVIEAVVSTAVDGAGDVVDAVTDVVQGGGADGGPSTPAAPGPIPIPYPNLSGMTIAVQDLADFAQQRVREIGNIAGTSVDAAAGIVSEALSRILPLVIGVLAQVAGSSGGRDISDLIGRLAAGIDRLVGALAPRTGGASGEGQAAAAEAARNLRELGQMLRRDADWKRANLGQSAIRLSSKPRPRLGKPLPGTSNSSTADPARVRRMLARLSLLDLKLARLQGKLALRGPRFTDGVRALNGLRNSLQSIHRATGFPPSR